MVGKAVEPQRRDMAGEAGSKRVAPRHQAGAAGRADGSVGIGLGEPHPPAGQGVDVGGLVKGASLDSQIHPAHIVDEDENNVRRTGLARTQRFPAVRAPATQDPRIPARGTTDTDAGRGARGRLSGKTEDVLTPRSPWPPLQLRNRGFPVGPPDLLEGFDDIAHGGSLPHQLDGHRQDVLRIIPRHCLEPL